MVLSDSILYMKLIDLALQRFMVGEIRAIMPLRDGWFRIDPVFRRSCKRSCEPFAGTEAPLPAVEHLGWLPVRRPPAVLLCRMRG